jgi:hypothetical protein
MCEEPNTEAVRARVIDFCKSEFEGDQARQLKLVKSRCCEVAAVNFTEEQVDIVDSYKVISIMLEGNHASVVIEYDLLGRFTNVRYYGYPGSNSKFEPGVWIDLANKLTVVHNPRFRQTVSLTFEPQSKQWLIVSLQRPKISKKALLDLLHKEVDADKETLSRNPGKDLTNIKALISWNEHKIKLIEDMNSVVPADRRVAHP